MILILCRQTDEQMNICNSRVAYVTLFYLQFVDMLSAIGGTMGLLTGFSIISGVEILYFVVKIILVMMKENINK